MTDLKKWIPFRFPRRRARNPEMPARSPSANQQSLASMRDEVERMFERFWVDPLAALDTQDRWFGDFSAPEFQPKVDVTDDKSCLRIALEIPGVDEKDLDIEVQDNVLTVKCDGRKTAQKKFKPGQLKGRFGMIAKGVRFQMTDLRITGYVDPSKL